MLLVIKTNKNGIILEKIENKFGCYVKNSYICS
jgi:hypothetical protein